MQTNLVAVLRIVGVICFFFAAVGVPFVPADNRPWFGGIGWLGAFFFGLTLL